MEGKLMTETFSRLFENDSLDSSVAVKLQEYLVDLEELLDGLGFCLSANGDLLSQWRGYAQNGEGFSIGFSKEYLELLAKEKKPWLEEFRLRKVLYKPTEHEAALLPTYTNVKAEMGVGGLKMPVPPGLITMAADPLASERYEKARADYFTSLKAVISKLYGAFPNLFTLKSEAFEEEKEWRLISFLTKTDNDRCEYRADAGRLIPYRAYELTALNVTEIPEVVIGPRNTTPEYVVRKILEQHGFANVSIRRSRATYR